MSIFHTIDNLSTPFLERMAYRRPATDAEALHIRANQASARAITLRRECYECGKKLERGDRPKMLTLPTWGQPEAPFCKGCLAR